MSLTPEQRCDEDTRRCAPTAEVSALGVTASDGRRLLTNVSLTLNPGRIVAVTGTSGAGKTTLLRVLLGHLPSGTQHSAGHVHVLGHDMLGLDEAARREIRRTKIAYVGQDPASALNPRLRVRTLLKELSTDPAPTTPRDLLEAVRLPTEYRFASRRPGELSGGQLRRVALARALSRQPALLLLDEPTAGLDPALCDEIAALLRRLTHEHSLSVAFTSHDADVVERLADEVVELGAAKDDRRRHGSGPVAVPRLTPANPVSDTGAAEVPALDVRDLSVTFGRRAAGRPVLDRVHLAVAQGSAAAVVGASGSGKTTLARALVGLQRSRTGTMRVGGTALPLAMWRRTQGQRRRVQLITQNPLSALNPSRTVGSQVARPLRLHRRVSSGSLDQAVEDLLSQVGLPADFAGRYPHELSGGQRQRVAIARALAAEPDILICDEITSALDQSTGDAVMDLLQQLRENRAMTLIVISHDLPLVRERTDTVTVLADGRVVESGCTAVVFADPQHAATHELVRARL
ncbi:ABC transporter ATP-binding protein [Streptomyces sp. NPDC088812]|uniref:ABC transporter ATP-binding protein n=1 Tax=Streptomyces sp. NPDC088812 TaxID=3365905 RepID=UPI0037F2BBDD